jgi:hypothetical protein
MRNALSQGMNLPRLENRLIVLPGHAQSKVGPPIASKTA